MPVATDLRVLVIEDERAVAGVVDTALDARGYDVTVATNGRDGLALASDLRPDLVILDLGLPDIDGIDVCRQLRRWFPNPIIVLSADGAEDRKVRALDEGADDYVTKPFSMPELLARLRVASRHRDLVASAIDHAVLEIGDTVIDSGARTVTVDGARVELARKEFDILELLSRQPGKVVTHGMILGRVWGGRHHGTTETLRVHVSTLRRKLGDGPRRPRVVAEPGVGYRVTLDPAD